MAQKQYSRSIARLVLVAGMCFTAIGLCSVSASAIDDTELLQPVAIKEDSLQPIGQSVLLADVSEENWYEGTSGSLYYCYADGTYATGITTLPNEETYLFALDGTLKTGWQTIDGVRYYFDLTTVSCTTTYSCAGSGIVQSRRANASVPVRRLHDPQRVFISRTAILGIAPPGQVAANCG